MSLLMDALKKAELAKRQGRGEDTQDANEPSVGGLTLEPRLQAIEENLPEVPAIAPTAPERLPNLPSHLEELDAQFLASHTPSPVKKPTLSPAPKENVSFQEPATLAPPPRPATTESRPAGQPEVRQESPPPQAAAQNLFAAKQTEKPAPRKSFAIAIGVLTVLAVMGIGGYFWWQLQPKSGLAMIKPPQLPAPASHPPAPVATTVVPQAAPPAIMASSASVAPASKEDDDEEDKPVPPKPERAQASRTPVAAEPDSPVRVSRAPLRVNPLLMRAYDAFGRGDLAAAQTDYEKVLKSEPRNTDAMHGLAAIALRNGRQDQAEWLYQRILEADPQDNIALSALINTKGPVDVMAAESRLKTLAASQPDLSAPHFALGNLYARQARWEEAQQAYFRAYSAEADNPDILYNLAVSLEHLRQTKLAIQYYGLALAAAQTRSAGFDKAQAATHLRSLQP